MNPLNRGYPVTAKDKQFLALEREYNKLRDVQRNAPLIELDEPYQHGWVRFFQLRYDAARRKDANHLKEILKRINTYQYCRTGKFMQKENKKKKWVPIGHHPRKFTNGDWDRLNWDSCYKKYFEYRLVTEMNWQNRRVRNHYYVFRYPFYFVSHIEKHFITHLKTVYPEVESRLAEIDLYFEHHQVRKRLLWLNGYSNSWWNRWRNKSRGTIQYQEIHLGMEEFNHE